MSGRWAITPAALGIAAAVGFVGVTGVTGLDQDRATPLPAGTSTTATDWAPGSGLRGRGSGSGYASDGWGWYPGSGGSGSGTATTTDETLSSTAAAAAAEVTPSVVNIDTVVDYGTGDAAGTGIVLSADGLVLTYHHVVEGATKITGTVVGTGRTYTATVLGYDTDTDIAVIDLAGATGLPVASFGDADALQVGDLVVGVGNAGGDGGEPTSVEGVVTALGQTITATDQNGGNAETLENLIGTDADIQSGQSGGPLVDADGDVVGVDVAASADGRGSSTSGFAIPIDDARAVAAQIIAGNESGTIHIGATPFLGVQLADSSATSGGWSDGGLGGYGYGDDGGSYGFGFGFGSGSGQQFGGSDAGPGAGGSAEDTATSDGVAIAGVVQGSAAESVGLSAGDVITALDGTAVTSAEQLSSVIAAHDAGDRVTIAWTDSSGGQHQATATLGAGPVG